MKLFEYITECTHKYVASVAYFVFIKINNDDDDDDDDDDNNNNNNIFDCKWAVARWQRL
jgi:hypothetical protein